ncbi:hypothetical protein D3C78_1219810 [compost metagenome]
MGKYQRLRAEVARLSMGHFLFGPGQEQRALRFEEGLQLRRFETLGDAGFLFADNVEIHQGHVDVRQLQFLAHQPAIDFRLGPMQLAMIGWLLGQVAPVGLHFFKALANGVVAVGPAFDCQCLVMTVEGHLGLITLAAPRGDGTMAGDTFQGRGRWCEAQVEVTHLGGELTQRPYGDAVAGCRGHAAPSRASSLTQVFCSGPPTVGASSLAMADSAHCT